MYKGKKLMCKRSWWRHPIFPWGWYSLKQDVPMKDGELLHVDGHSMPNDGGMGTFIGVSSITEND